MLSRDRPVATMRALYTLTIFLGSALLFLVQPMVAKMILPVFGGSPGVWATSMVFFQAMLLLGYAYAHGSVRLLGARRQPLAHLGLLALALLALPFGLRPEYAPPATSQPAPHVLLLLLGMVGLPFFAVAAQAPLIQRWFADTPDPRARDPYFLYSASNVGSLLALAAYPLLLEPRLRLMDQSRLWSAGYVGLVLLTGVSALALWRSGPAAEATAEAEPDVPPTALTRPKWVLLAAAPSSLLLGATTHVTTNIAPVPLLWIVPLTLYLLTFILAFSTRARVESRRLAMVAGPVAVVLGAVIALDMLNPVAIPVHLLGFFVVAWTCHARLAESRPSASRLTEFYLWMSLGGVLGGAFNALLAPLVFDRVLEYPLALIVAAALFPRQAAAEQRFRLYDLSFPAALLIVALGMRLVHQGGPLPLGIDARQLLVVLAGLCLLAARRPPRLALALAVLTLAGPYVRVVRSNDLFRARSFFAPMRVSAWGEGGEVHDLAHGNILHGQQILSPDLRRVPISYYHPSGPIGDIFREFSEARAPSRVAVVGLGVGTLAAWSRPGQEFAYYEIDPLVQRIASDTRLFTYLADAPAKARHLTGDARLRLKEAQAGAYDLIFLDAFSSDAVPVHLLTQEAIQMYLEKLSPRGLLVFNTTNRYLRIDRVLGRGADALGLAARVREDLDDERFHGKTTSRWLVIARREDDLGALALDPRWRRPGVRPDTPLWTDDFSNIVSVFEPFTR